MASLTTKSLAGTLARTWLCLQLPLGPSPDADLSPREDEDKDEDTETEASRLLARSHTQAMFWPSSSRSTASRSPRTVLRTFCMYSAEVGFAPSIR